MIDGTVDGTDDGTDDGLDAAVEALRDLIAASDAYRVVAADAIGLGISDVHALGHLVRHPAIPQGDLARAVGVSPSGATVLVERLQCAGMVRRVPDPSDRRHVLIELTAHGRQMIELSTERVRQVFDGLDPDELQATVATLRRLVVSAQRQVVIAAEIVRGRA